MPSKTQTARRRDTVSPSLVHYLKTGVNNLEDSPDLDIFLLSHPDKREELGGCWRDLGPEILKATIAETPGCRPYGWWLFDCPRATVDADEPRWWAARLVPARHVFDADGRRTCLDLDAAEDRRRGVPYIPVDEGAATVESEPAYLKRLGVLTAGEAKRLTADDYQPEAFADADDDPPRPALEDEKSEEAQRGSGCRPERATNRTNT